MITMISLKNRGGYRLLKTTPHLFSNIDNLIFIQKSTLQLFKRPGLHNFSILCLLICSCKKDNLILNSPSDYFYKVFLFLRKILSFDNQIGELISVIDAAMFKIVNNFVLSNKEWINNKFFKGFNFFFSLFFSTTPLLHALRRLFGL